MLILMQCWPAMAPLAACHLLGLLNLVCCRFSPSTFVKVFTGRVLEGVAAPAPPPIFAGEAGMQLQSFTGFRANAPAPRPLAASARPAKAVAQRQQLIILKKINNSYRFRVPHQVCLPGSRSKTVRAMRCETCIHAVVTA